MCLGQSKLRNTEVSLFSDSRSGLQTIANPDNRCSIAISILSMSKRLEHSMLRSFELGKGPCWYYWKRISGLCREGGYGARAQDWAQKLPKSYLREALRPWLKTSGKPMEATTNGLVTKNSSQKYQPAD
ncbi:hypothetical protein JTE90_025066 [Oedothorax gibbosus]|uniref:Uncharacterized protein n=1 Tax=Oedothorax gibbosus TaxID=931172 RepID=A0AAV6TSY4_9ARAC|nr:hypothetical protein JTE90_025066 [Oedothorax gibbosus]